MAKITATIKGCPIIHNGTRYDIGTTIELDETEAAKIALYLDDVQPVKNGEDNNVAKKAKSEGNKKAEISDKVGE
ncbi:hypothetical protein L4F91_06785 [Avibacterium sp. 20-126]|uniref:DUF7210 family protein n=1 Tax=Avibacterium sp. 20-126 TaxID=2911524 RepID=UPI00218897AF|nr:hypothetical protein L4F91_06785 [Avibacterium sp. 20-126]